MKNTSFQRTVAVGITALSFLSSAVFAQDGTGTVDEQAEAVGEEVAAQQSAGADASGPRQPLDWLTVLVEGGRDAADVLTQGRLNVQLLNPTTGETDLLQTRLGIPDWVTAPGAAASLLIDRFPMVLAVDADRDPAPQLNKTVTLTQLWMPVGDGSSEDNQMTTSPLSWTTLVPQAGSEKLVSVLFLPRSQYCPLVDPALVPDCDGVVPETPTPEAGTVTAETVTEDAAETSGDATAETAEAEADTSGEAQGGEDIGAVRPAMRPQPVPYTVTLALGFAGLSEGRVEAQGVLLGRRCEIEFTRSADSAPLAAQVETVERKPELSVAFEEMPDQAVDLSDARVRFLDNPDDFDDCPYEGATFAVGALDQQEAAFSGTFVLPPQNARFDLIYDLSGTTFDEDRDRSSEFVLQFASLVADTLDRKLKSEARNYGQIVDYFAWSRDNFEPTVVPMSDLDADRLGAPQRPNSYLWSLNSTVKSEMVARMAESSGGLRPQDIGGVLDDAGGQFATLLETGEIARRDKNLRVLVQVADTARNACLDTAQVNARANSDIRPTIATRIVAVAELAVAFSPEHAERVPQSMMWRCKPNPDYQVSTWLVSLDDVVRANDWAEMAKDITDLDGRLVP